MKPKNFNKTILFSLFAVFLLACNDDEKKTFPFNLEQTSIEIPAQRTCDFSVISGNGDYTFHIDNNEIIDVYFVPDINVPFGVIRVDSKQKGETTLSVTDNATQTTIKLPVKVTDKYIGFNITESNHTALTLNRWVYLVNNERKDAYFFENNPDEQCPASLLAKGSYEFTMENNNAYLTLYYSESEGQFTEAAIAPTAHKFNISESELRVLQILKIYLNINCWDNLLPESRTSVITPLYIHLKAEDSNQNIIGRASSELMPENILK
ncbi:hypothetical protein [Bacteroides sp.]